MEKMRMGNRGTTCLMPGSDMIKLIMIAPKLLNNSNNNVMMLPISLMNLVAAMALSAMPKRSLRVLTQYEYDLPEFWRQCT